MKIPIFTGASAALITPFLDNEVDYSSLEKIIEMQIDAHSEAITVCGTTGEGSTLSDSEYEDIIKFAVKAAGNRCKIIAGSGSNSTKTAVKKSKIAEQCGADGLLVVTPYYNKTSQKGLVCHYENIAENTQLPIILYNVPSRTGLSFTAETYKILSEVPNINGIKEASGNMSLIAKTKRLCKDDMNIWSGNDNETIETMALGGAGVISVAANIIPKIMMKISDFCDDSDYTEARKIAYLYYDFIESMFFDVNPIPIKYIMQNMGIIPSCETRLPLTHLDDKTKNSIDNIIDKYKSEGLI